MRVSGSVLIGALLAGALTVFAQKPLQPAAESWYFGAIDVGSKGDKSTLFRFTREGDWKDTQVITAATRNSCLVGKMTADKRFTADCIQEATANTAALLKEMELAATARKIAKVRYFVVGSSGVSLGANKGELAASVKAATGLDMEFIDAASEGRYGLVSAVPPAFRDRAVMIDQGSGNVKIACQDKDPTDIKTAEIPLGTVSTSNEALGLSKLLRSAREFSALAKRVQGQAESAKRTDAYASLVASSSELGALTISYSDPKQNVRSGDLIAKAQELAALAGGIEGAQDLTLKARALVDQAVTIQKIERDFNAYAGQIARVMEDDVKPVYLREARNKPCLVPQATDQPGRVYLLGGGPWAAATFSHPELSLNNYVAITRQDLGKILTQLRAGNIPKSVAATTQPQWRRARTIRARSRREAEVLRLTALDKKAALEREQVLKVFSRDHQLSGISLLDAMLEGIAKAGAPDTKVFFVRNGSYIYGYALEKYREARDSQ